MAKQPNILILFSDQHNAKVLGCYGNKQVRTPHLDRLAGEGVRFEHAFTQNPICTPSRTCWLSGQYVRNHGYYGLDGNGPAQLPSLFSHAKTNGYRTGMSGKIHTPHGWLPQHCDSVSSCYAFEKGAPDIYADYLQSKGIAKDRDDVGGRDKPGTDARPSFLHEDDTAEAWCAAETIKFLEESKNDDRPFCYWMSLPRPHSNYIPAKRFWDLYDTNKLELPPSADDSLEDRHWTMRNTKKGQMGNGSITGFAAFEPRDYDSYRRRVLHGYYGCVSMVDDAVGRVMKRLEELGLRENTIVVYSTDHGDFAGEHGIIEKAPGISSRAITRIPWIWSWPGHLPQGKVSNELVETVDLLPTLCALAGLPAPDWVDGHDITSLLQGKEEPVRKVAVTENYLTHSVHTKRYTLVNYTEALNGGEDFGELFDLEEDPWERVNRYFDPSYKHIVDELRRLLLDWSFSASRAVTIHPPPPPGTPGWESRPEAYAGDGKLKRENVEIILEAPRGGWQNYI